VIGPGVTCDLSRLILTRMLVQASSGAGKSWLLRRLLEQSHGKVQQIVIDPEGEFSSLREKYDYVLAARKGGDTLADPRTAKLLAERLLEIGVSAILDIYELSARDRVSFVRLFLEALVDAPKKLWHPVLVVLDEAHVYCPEKDAAESADAVKGLCSRGRKRGFCAVLATQRLSKLAKDAAAECNNKLIGRSSLDVDMARAGDELGFSKADRLTLRDLEDGEFYAFGPALSRVVTKVRVGGVNTHHPKAGALAAVVPPPSKRVLALLPKLSDLPAEAEAREQTMGALRAELVAVRLKLSAATKQAPTVETKTIEKPVLKPGQMKHAETLVTRLLTASGELALAAKTISDAMARVGQNATRPAGQSGKTQGDTIRDGVPLRRGNGAGLLDSSSTSTPRPATSQTTQTRLRSEVARELPPGELAILTAVVQYPGLDRKRLSVLVGYKRSSRDAYIARLSNRGYVTANRELYPTKAGQEALGDAYEPLPSGPALVGYWREKLPEGELKLFNTLVNIGPGVETTRELIREAVPEFKRSSSDAYLGRLVARGLVTILGRGRVALAESLSA
jgi:hypothetical protein